MTKRSINSSIEEILVSNSEFEYAHLIKFERPFAKDPESPDFRTNANRYAYFTDASRDISFNDGSTDQDGASNGSQVYRANRVKSIGSYSETTAPRATNMGLTLSGDHLGTSVSITGDFGSAAFTVDSTFHDDADSTDLIDFGFREGDKVKITKNSGTFSTGVTSVIYIITGFSNNNRTMAFTTTGDDSDDITTYPTDTSVSVTISLESEELKGVLADKATLTLANPAFLNREVFIHKVFIDPETGNIQGNSSILIFKGIIAGCSIDEGPNGSNVKWNLTSHWGDWSQVGGRLTTDDTHRALDGNGKPQPNLTIKPEYADDLGFIHSETTLSAIANYKTYETVQKYSTKKRGGIAGLFGGKKTVIKEEQKEIDNEVDLTVGLQGKFLPVVYGVQRLAGIPIFADTDANDSKIVYVADAISEGEIHGLYNLYIDGIPLICTDAADAAVRNSISGADKDNSQLQCYGRADRGDTIGGTAETSAATALTNFYNPSSPLSQLLLEAVEESTDPNELKVIYNNLLKNAAYFYANVTQDNVPSITASSADALGLSHGEHGSISHPHNMSFTFFKGSNSQLASNMLVTQAEGTGFKRQNDYYESSIPYWSPNHRLLDTAYMVNSFVISADSTEIPELEYVVRGRVLECYNFDNSYVPDDVLGGSDDEANFKEGDTVTVERSTDGSSWSTTNVEGNASDTSFRILHKYLLTTNDGSTHYRFLLDQTPDLDAVNGLPAKTYLRLKQAGASNYWHMRTFNHRNITNQNFAVYAKSPTAVGVNGSNEIQFTFSTSDANLLKAGYTDELANQPGKALYSFFTNNCTALTNLKDGQAVGTWDGDTLTLKNVIYDSTKNNNVAIGSVTNVLNIDVYKSRNFFMGGPGAPFDGFDNNADFTGATITLNHSGESRRITSYVAGEKRIEIESPFKTLTETDYDAGIIKFDISGTQGDKRAVTNTALQLLDYMKDPRYGKNLDVNNDIDLASFISSAKLCEVRGTLTLGTRETNLTIGDYYKITDGSGNHLGSGRVKTFTSNSVTFDNLSGKFIRLYGNHIAYADDEYIVTDEGNLYQKSGAGYLSTKPTHTSGTIGGATYISPSSVTINSVVNKISSFDLTRESGSGAATLTIDVSGGPAAIAPTYSLYDSDFVKYWRYMGWEHHKQCFVTRHQTNFIIDTSKSIFENMSVFLSHMNGMLSYESGKYVLDIETQVTAPTASNTFNSVTYDWNVNPEYIDNTDIIGSISLTDNSARNAKNTIKASITDPQNNWSSRSVSFFNSSFLEADRKVVKTGNFNYTGITNYYNARIGTEKELIQTRFSREISFKLGPKGLLLKAGQVISLNYEPFGFSSKLFRINNLNFNPDCSVSVKATEYDDSMYVISAVRANELRQEAATQAQPLSAPSAPTGLSATTTRPGSVILTWTNPADFVDQSDDVEIWVSDDNNRENATLLHVELGNVTNFTYTTAGAGTKFYWVRVRRVTNQLKSKKLLTSAYHPTSATGGVTGTSKILSPDVQLSHGAINFFFDSDGVLDPSGAAQDVTVTATLLNLTATPTFSLVEADGSSQSDITFTTGATSLSGSSATVDASSASVSTTPKLLKVTVTESGETFTRQIPIGILKSGSIGVDGDDGLRTIQGYLYYESTGSTAPSAPSGNTYTFTTGVVTGTGINDSGTTNVWKNSPNTTDATSTNTYWTVRYFGTEASANSSTISVTYSNVVQFTNFDGVVTFSNGTFSEVGGTAITTIDGGNIDTGTITADKIKLSGTGSLSITSLDNDANFITSAGAPVQSVANLTGAITTANLSAQGLRLTSDFSGFATVATTGSVGDTTGTLPTNRGGTGRTSTASYVADLSAAGLRLTSDFSGFSTVATTGSVGDTTGTLPVNRGGTGKTSTASYVADLSAAGLRLTSDFSGFATVATTGSVGDTTGTLPTNRGGTGRTSTAAYVADLSAAGLTLTSNLGDAATASIADIRAGTTKADVGLSNVDNDSTATIRAGTTKSDVGLGSVTNANPAGQLTGAFSAVTSVTAGNIFIGAASSATTNYIELSAANANIIIADNT